MATEIMSSLPSMKHVGAASLSPQRRATLDSPMSIRKMVKPAGRSRRSQSITACHTTTPSETLSMSRKKRSKDVKALPSIPSVGEDDDDEKKGVKVGSSRSLRSLGLPDMDWTTVHSKKDGNGSTGTETTMDMSVSNHSHVSTDSKRRQGEKPDMDWGAHGKACCNRDDKEGCGHECSSAATKSGDLLKKGSGHRKKRLSPKRDSRGSSSKNSSGEGSGRAAFSNMHRATSGGNLALGRLDEGEPVSGRKMMRRTSSHRDLDPKTLLGNDPPSDGTSMRRTLSSGQLVPMTPGGKKIRVRVQRGSPLIMKVISMESGKAPSPKRDQQSKASLVPKEREEALGSDWFADLKDISMSNQHSADEDYSSSEEEETASSSESSDSDNESDSFEGDDADEDPKKQLAAEKRTLEKKRGQPRLKQLHRRRGNGGPQDKLQKKQRGTGGSHIGSEGDMRRRRRKDQGVIPPSTPKSRQPRSKSVAQRLMEAVDEACDKTGIERKRPEHLKSPFETEVSIEPNTRRVSRRSPDTVPAPASEALGYNAPMEPQTPRRRGRRASLGSTSMLSRSHDESAMTVQSETGDRSIPGRRRLLASRKGCIPINDGTDEDEGEDFFDHPRSRGGSYLDSALTVDEGDSDDDHGAGAGRKNYMMSQSERISERRMSQGHHRSLLEPMTPGRLKARTLSLHSLNKPSNFRNPDDGSIERPMKVCESREVPRRSEPSSMEPMTPRRRGARSASLRSLHKLNIDNLDDEDDGGQQLSKASSMGSRVGGLPTLSAHFSQESNGRGRQEARDNVSVGENSTGSSGGHRSRSSSRNGRYGYNNGVERLCLSAVPSTPKKTVGLAALLYCKPLDLVVDNEEEEQNDSVVSDNQTNEMDGGSTHSLVHESGTDEIKNSAADKKAQAKKEYWKAKLAGKQ